MLASIFSKATGSLGKTYVYSGLFPAGALLIILALSLTSTSTLFQTAQSILVDQNAWKSLAWAAAAWLLLAFLFYAVRAPLASIFQHIPSSRIGRRLILRGMKRRERAKRRQIEIEWRGTALIWLTQLNLDRTKIGQYPSWIVRPSPEVALMRSQRGRESLVAVDRTVGDVLNLSVTSGDTVSCGIFSLFLIASHQHDDAALETAIKAEIAAWRSAAGSENAKNVLTCIEQDIKRKFTKAFLATQRFGDGPYVFPTELGNRISALDDYARRPILHRYGSPLGPFVVGVAKGGEVGGRRRAAGI